MKMRQISTKVTMKQILNTSIVGKKHNLKDILNIEKNGKTMQKN